ncbi:MAG: hypothetical protein Q9190_003723 [Brigantiaea leucoxantha]
MYPDYAPYSNPYHQQQPQLSYPSYNPSQPALFNQPHAPPEGQAHRLHPAPLQHVPNPSHGQPNPMPPPSTIPDTSFHRQNYYPQLPPRAPDRWPLGVTDEQRQLQEQYKISDSRQNVRMLPSASTDGTFFQSPAAQTPQINANFSQPVPFASAPPTTGPVSTFSPPAQTPPPSQGPPPTSQPSNAPTPQPPKSREFPAPTAAATAQSQEPMTAPAAPPLPSHPTPPSSEPSKAAPSQNSVALPLESQRVTALLDLNRVLLQEVVLLQNAGRAGTPAQPQPQQQQQQQPSPPTTVHSETPTPKSLQTADATNSAETGVTNNSKPFAPNQPSQQPQQPGRTPASKEYIEYMRRLQANLAYLASVADRGNKPGSVVPNFPAIMEAPVLPGKDKEKEGENSLKEIYGRLKELWPEYKAKNGGAVGTTA